MVNFDNEMHPMIVSLQQPFFLDTILSSSGLGSGSGSGLGSGSGSGHQVKFKGISGEVLNLLIYVREESFKGQGKVR